MPMNEFIQFNLIIFLDFSILPVTVETCEKQIDKSKIIGKLRLKTGFQPMNPEKYPQTQWKMYLNDFPENEHG